MKFAFSIHAIEQMEKRNISMAIAEKVLADPQEINFSGSIAVYQRILSEYEKSYLFRIFVNADKQPPLVVTAYKTSKIKKYDAG